MFGQIETLVRKIDYSSMKADHAIKKVASSGDPVHQVSQSNAGAGGVHMAVNLQNLNKYKRGSINAFQNALSMMQMQSEGLRQAEKIYNRMLSVAQMASDPSADSQTRGLLAKEFADLREQSIAINSMTVNGKDLFDARAASTQYNVEFSGGLQAHPHNIENGGMKSDGTFVSDATNSDRKGTSHPYWEVTKDVVYKTGELTIDFRPYGAWDRVMVFQDDQYNPLFDSGQWQTVNNGGGSINSKYDRFKIKYGPARTTTFSFEDSPVNQNGGHTHPIYGNQSTYLSKFGLTNDGSSSGMSAYYQKELTELGQVKTGTADPNSTELTVRVIGKAWRGTGYNVEANWSPLKMDDSVVGRTDDMQVQLNQMGLGYLRNNEDGFPTISVGTTADALKAIDVLRAEIDNLGEQNGRLGSNYTRVEIAMDAAQKQLMTQEKALSHVGGTDFTADLIELSKTRIERHQNAALMTQAMSIHQDIVNLLI